MEQTQGSSRDLAAVAVVAITWLLTRQVWLSRRSFGWPVIGVVLLPAVGLAASLPCENTTMQTNFSAVSTYQPALPSYDFNAGISRWGSDDSRLQMNEHKSVGRVYINTLPIFDTTSEAERYALYRWINRLHGFTQPVVIEQMVLFKPGETVDDQTLDESERLLRQQKYVRDATIRVVGACNNVVDLEVITREVWTLTPEVSVKTTGGETSSTLGFRDTNFLGLGHYVSLGFEQSEVRDQLQFHYKDPNFRGSRVAIETYLEKNTDGYDRQLSVVLPFYALDSRQSWGLSLAQSQLSQIQYRATTPVSALQVERQELEIFYGASRGLQGATTQRYRYGVQVDQRRYAPLAGQLATVEPASDLNLIYPFVEYQLVEDDYKVGFNINQMRRSEDIHVGRGLRARFGYALANGQQLIAEGEWTNTWLAVDKMLLQSTFDWHGRWNRQQGDIEDGAINLGVIFHRGQTQHRSLVFGLVMSMLHNSRSSEELTLGGSQGLRGYQSRYLSGDSTLVLFAEQRLFTDYAPFGLFNVGFAAFVDAGRGWFRGQDPQVMTNSFANGLAITAPSVDDGWKTDVGIGLRLMPSKAGDGQVIHLNVAAPLQDRAANGNYLISVEVKKTL